MPFNPICARARDRFPSDLSDAEWQVLASLLLPPRTTRRGRPRRHSARAIVNAIRYLVRTGCPWRYLPGSFPPWKTVYWYFHRWAAEGALHRAHAALRDRLRAQQGRDPRPSAAIIDSQSVRGADTVPKSSRGWDNGKKVNGRKRHIAVDVLGLVLAVAVTGANVQDRDAAKPLLARIAAAHWLLGLVWADAGYAGKLESWALEKLDIVLHVVRKLPGQSTFVVLPRRWVVERSLAWISKHRRCVRDYERLPAHHEAMVLWATTSHMLKRLT